MKIFDKHRRVIVEFSSRRVQIAALYIEQQQPAKTHWQLIIGWDKGWLLIQQRKEQCSKCQRWVLHACEIPSDPERSMQSDGPWDFLCDEFYNPWRYK